MNLFEIKKKITTDYLNLCKELQIKQKKIHSGEKKRYINI